MLNKHYYHFSHLFDKLNIYFVSLPDLYSVVLATEVIFHGNSELKKCQKQETVYTLFKPLMINYNYY